MSEEPSYYLTGGQWHRVLHAAGSDPLILRDGAEVEVVDLPDEPEGDRAVTFYATRANAPKNWPYPFLERDDAGHSRTYIGDAQRESNGHIVLQVWLKEAVEQLLADYEGGATDLDEAAVDMRVGEVAAGREEDRKWLAAEFTALLATCEIAPSSSPS